MGQVVTNSNGLAISGTLPTKVVPAGYLGEFGKGQWKVIYRTGSFVVPAGVSQIRVRAVGAGGGANAGTVNTNGGAGGGYAHGVFTVTPLQSILATIGLGSAGGAGGTTSFGGLLSASGGGAGTTAFTAPSPGTGSGGDYQATGGTSAVGASVGSGGGAAGTQLGTGGSSMSSNTGGAGVCGGNSFSTPGASAFGPSILTAQGSIPGPAMDGVVAVAVQDTTSVSKAYGTSNLSGASIRFPFDGFIGGGSVQAVNTGGSVVFTIAGSGAGGGFSNTSAGPGGTGGGGGGSASAQSGGTGGLGGGGAGSSAGGGPPVAGGDGFIVVEW